MLRFLYNTTLGRIVLKLLVKTGISKSCGKFMDSRCSLFLVEPFFKKKRINKEEFICDGFKCFNDCFTRKIKEGRRNINMEANAFISPCDGLLSVYPINKDTVLPVKQSKYTISELLKSDELAKEFEGGKCFVFRLCVNHYHRYIYPDDGHKGLNVFIPGILHTVQPIALKKVPVFTENCREYTVMDTKNYGKLVMIEVGAMLVGRIVNYHKEYNFKRGEEKGRFEYGGSTIIILTRKNVVDVLPAIVTSSASGKEYPVKMGEKIGNKQKEVN